MVTESYEIGGESNLHDKLTAIKNLAKSYDMRMRGFKWDTLNDKWVPAGLDLAGNDFITQSVGILTSFAEPANLITTKSIEKFARENADAFFRINTMILNDVTIPQENYRAVIKMFKDTLSNIGDIITGSRVIMKGLYANDSIPSGGSSGFD